MQCIASYLISFIICDPARDTVQGTGSVVILYVELHLLPLRGVLCMYEWTKTRCKSKHNRLLFTHLLFNIIWTIKPVTIYSHVLEWKKWGRDSAEQSKATVYHISCHKGSVKEQPLIKSIDFMKKKKSYILLFFDLTEIHSFSIPLFCTKFCYFLRLIWLLFFLCCLITDFLLAACIARLLLLCLEQFGLPLVGWPGHTDCYKKRTQSIHII